MIDFDNIRLVAADMDGTLLNSKRELPPDLAEVINRLNDKGIRFAAASGRSYSNLRLSFTDVDAPMIYIADNGGNIVDDRTVIYEHGFTPVQLAQVEAFMQPIRHVYLMYSSAECGYLYASYPQEIKDFYAKYYRVFHEIDSVSEITSLVNKVTIYDPSEEGAEVNTMPLLQPLTADYDISLDGFCWCNIGLTGTCKGKAIEFIQNKYGIRYEQTMIFGDYLNDCSMMPKAYYSYAMGNAHPDLAKLCRFQTASNDEDGVMKIVRQLL
jgi:Cof subfamily protein (haloacid dehalogenase superfamily)